MKNSWIKSALIYGGAIVVVALLGIWLGSMFGQRRVEAGRQAEQEQLEKYLQQNMVGIEVGKMFPDVPVWSADGTQAYGIHELLPRGGVLVYVASGCNSCFDALQALAEAQRDAGSEGRDVIVVADGNPDSLTAGLIARGLHPTFYHDAQSSFARDYKVAVFPTSFVLEDGGRVIDMVAGTHTVTDFESVLRP